MCFNIGLNLDQLLYKEKLCMEMLDLLQRLKLGQCRLLGKYKIEYYDNSLCTITIVYHLIKKKIKILTYFF